MDAVLIKYSCNWRGDDHDKRNIRQGIRVLSAGAADIFVVKPLCPDTVDVLKMKNLNETSTSVDFLMWINLQGRSFASRKLYCVD